MPCAFCFYAQSLSEKERDVVLPLKMTTFIMQSVAFILCHQSSYNAQFSLTLNDLTLLEAIFIPQDERVVGMVDS